MVLLAGALFLAVAAGYLFGGRLRNLEALSLRLWPLALAGLALQFLPLPRSAVHTLGFVVLMVSFAALIAFAALNRRVSGMSLVIVGLLLNCLVIGINRGMPVTRSALIRSGQSALLHYLVEHGGAKHHLSGGKDDLVFIADSIAIPRPIGQVVSVGDLLVYAGIIWIIAAAMRRDSPEREMAQLQGKAKNQPQGPSPDPPRPPPESTNPGK
jgi:hypothetical protein